MRRVAFLALCAIALLFGSPQYAVAFRPAGETNTHTRPIFSVAFSNDTPGALASLHGLSFSRASSATVQTGTSTVVTAGIGTDVPRAGRRLDSDTIGLVIEESRLNAVLNRDQSTGWTAGTATPTAGQAGPDGTSSAVRWVAASGQYSNYSARNSAAGQWTFSEWVKQGSVGALGAMVGGVNFTTDDANSTVNATWGRIDSVSTNPNPTNGVIYLMPVSGADTHTLRPSGLVAGARDAVVDLPQAEAGLFPTEAIITSGAAATRQGERLWYVNGASLIPNGRLGMAVSLRPKGSSQEYSAPIRLWTIDANNYAEIGNTTGVLTVKVGGVANTTTSGLQWSRYDSLDLYVAAGGSQATEVYWRTNGGDVHVATIAGSALGTVTAASTIDLLCNGTANQFSSWVTSLSFWKNTDRPGWAIPAFLTYDFTTQSPGAATMPNGLAFARASSGYSVQTGTSTVLTSGGFTSNNVGRIGRANDSWSYGLVLEPTRQNVVLNSRVLSATGWVIVASTTFQATAGPDGQTLASRWNQASGNAGYQIVSIAGAFTASGWAKQGVTPGHVSILGNANVLAEFAASAAWQRFATRGTGATLMSPNDCIARTQSCDSSASSGAFQPANATIVAQNRDNYVDMLQNEPGSFPSEYIDNPSTTPNVRAGERLYLQNSINAIVNGQLRMAVRFRAKSDPAHADSAERIWTDGTDYAEESTSGVLTVSIGGVTNTAPVWWGEHDLVDLFIGAGGSQPTIVAYRINAETAQLPPVTGSALGNLSTAGALDIGCNGTSQQLASWIHTIAFYRPGYAPGWADTPLVWRANFTTLAAGSVSRLPGGLSFSRASSATVQTGTSTVVTVGIGTDVPRVGRAADADSLGLVMEPTRTNIVINNRTETGWNAGTATLVSTNSVGPDGAATAIRWTATSGQYSTNYAAGQPAGVYVGSQWTMQGSAASLGQMAVYANNAVTPSTDLTANATNGVAWGRISTLSGTNGAGSTVGIVPTDGRNWSAEGGIVAGARDQISDLAQLELGKWASEAIITTGASATRQGERLFYGTPANLIQNGRFNFYVRFQAKHSIANGDTTWNFLANRDVGGAAIDYVQFLTTGACNIIVGATIDTCAASALSWNAGDIVELFLGMGGNVATYLSYRVNGGTTVRPTISGNVPGNITQNNALDLLNYNATTQAGVRVYEIDVYRTGFVPYGM